MFLIDKMTSINSKQKTLKKNLLNKKNTFMRLCCMWLNMRGHMTPCLAYYYFFSTSAESDHVLS